VLIPGCKLEKPIYQAAFPLIWLRAYSVLTLWIWRRKENATYKNTTSAILKVFLGANAKQWPLK